MPLILENQFNNNILELISGSYDSDIVFNESEGDFIRMQITSNDTRGVAALSGRHYYSNRYMDYNFVNWELDPAGGPPTASLSENMDDEGNHYPVQLPVYYNESNMNDVFVKPNDVLDQEDAPSGTYRFRFDFFTDYFRQIETTSGIIDDVFTNFNDVRFIVSEISATRSEVRIIPRGIDATTGQTEVAHVFTSSSRENFYETLGTSVPEDPYPTYEYNYYLSFGDGTFETTYGEVLINNYQFDLRTSPSVSGSLVLKLNGTVPGGVSPLSTQCRIYKRKISSQYQDVNWFEETEIPEIWEGLEPDTSIETYWTSEPTDDFHSYDAVLSGSNTAGELEYIYGNISGSDNLLKIDYKSFENHCHFGSAAHKLSNFKDKFSEIQSYYTQISESLSVPTVASSSILAITRRELFRKIYDKVSTFTPYERFLYFDSQNQSTASAPSLGRDYSFTHPVTSLYGQSQTLVDEEGFPKVYKHYNNDDSDVEIFSGKYFADETPFYNSSGSFYLSFLIRSGSGEFINPSKWTLKNPNGSAGGGSPTLPEDAWSGQWIQSGSLSGSWNRWVLEASQSHWRPTTNINWDTSQITNWNNGSTHWEILSGSDVTGSESIVADGYPTFNQSSDGMWTTSSIVPSGELFNLKWSPTVATPEATSSLITDVRISTNNPTGSIPFMDLFPTGSTQFENWYTSISSSAVDYDEQNDHSLLSSLPPFYQEQSNEFANFVNMIGEHYDLLKNYIDNFETLHKRTYIEDDFASTKLMPILAENLGWDLVDPNITGSIAEYMISSASGSISKEEITDGMWRKVINNLIYIYKTKGTEASVRGLLNSYGYTGINIKEYGGIVEDDETEAYATRGQGGSNDNNPGRRRSMIDGSQILRTLVVNSSNYGLKLDHMTNGASNETIQFMFSNYPTSSEQDLLVSSGSNDEVLWKLKLVPSASSDKYAQVKFELGSAVTGSSTAVSMSTDYMAMKSHRDQKLWNVQLSAISSSITGSNGIQEYTLRVAHRDGATFASSSAVSMSVDGASSTENENANINWKSTGSLSSVSGNLVFGNPNFDGEFGQIKAWSTYLDDDSFYQYVNDPFINRGMSISSSFNDLNYSFDFADKLASGSNYTITDGNYNDGVNYSRGLNQTTFTNPSIRVRNIDYYLKGPIDSGLQENRNRIYYIPRNKQNFDNIDEGLSPVKNRITNPFINNEEISSNKLSIGVSNTDAIDKWIYRQISGYEISELIADPQSIYSSSYGELNTFRDDLFNKSGVEININKWLRAQETKIPKDLQNALVSLSPLRSDFRNDITIQSHFLERNRIKLPTASVHTGSAAGFYGPEFNTVNILKPSPNLITDINFEITGNGVNLYDNVSSTIYEAIEDNINLSNILKDSEVLTMLEATYNDFTKLESEILDLKESSISDLFTIDSSVYETHDVDYDMVDEYSFDASVLNILTDDLNLHKLIGDAKLYSPIIDEIDIIKDIRKIESEILNPKSISLDSLPNLQSQMYDEIKDNIGMIDIISEASVVDIKYDTLLMNDMISSAEVTNYISDIIDDFVTLESNVENNITDIIKEIPKRVYSNIMNPIKDDINMLDNISAEIVFNEMNTLDNKISKLGVVTNISSIEPVLNVIIAPSIENSISPEMLELVSTIVSTVDGNKDIIGNHYKMITSIIPVLIRDVKVSDIIKMEAYEVPTINFALDMKPLTMTGSVGIPVENYNSGSELYDRMVIMGASYGGPMWTEDTSGRLKQIMQVSGSPNSQHGASGMANTGIIEVRCHAGYGGQFQTYGDIEIISGSWLPAVDDGYGNNIHRNVEGMRLQTDYNDIGYFLNRKNTDMNKNGYPTGKTYKAYVNSSTSSIQPGIPMGRTAYYATGSSGRGDLVYPENHYFYAPDYHMLFDMAYVGTQTGGNAIPANQRDWLSRPSTGKTLVDPEGTETIRPDDDTKPWFSTKVPDENIIQLKNLTDK